MSSLKLWDGAWQCWMFEGFLLCRWLLEPQKASRLCKWVHTTQESAYFSNAQCPFHSSTCPLLKISTQHPHHTHPLLREHMRPDLDAWHPLWRGSQHAWWSCLQVLCLPFWYPRLMKKYCFSQFVYFLSFYWRWPELQVPMQRRSPNVWVWISLLWWKLLEWIGEIKLVIMCLDLSKYVSTYYF